MNGIKKETKKDRRVVKTQKAIRDAFLSLMSEKAIDQITMKEIAQRANVDRKTVYNYYGGIHAIHEALEDELIEQFENVMSEIQYSEGDSYVLFVGMTRVLQENIELYDRIIKMKHNDHLMQKIIHFLRKKIIAALDRLSFIAEDQKDMLSAFLTMGIFSVYYQWFNSDRKKPLEELSKEVNGVVRNVLMGFQKKI